MSRYMALFLVLIVAAGGAVGYAAGPLLARAHPRVRLAARVAQEEQEDVSQRTLSSQAVRDAGTAPQELYAEARSIEQQMSLGGAVFGAWLGLVVALKVAFGSRGDGGNTYDIDVSRCLACGRCFASCPHDERQGAGAAADIQDSRGES